MKHNAKDPTGRPDELARRGIGLDLGLAVAVVVAVVAAAPRLAHADALPLLRLGDPANDLEWALSLGGYGETHFSWLDHGANQNRPGGSQGDSRLVFDTTRLVFLVQGSLPLGFDLEAEVELEHGGTGSALELEYEEFGEFESEIEKGGEVLVEELYLEKHFDDWGSVRVGRFYVALGSLGVRYRPTDYSGTRRPETEEVILPGQWDEIGIDGTLTLLPVRVTAQLVSGLDSTGFSSQRFIGSGHQQRFELVRATDLAGVLRLDALLADALEIGASAYYGGTSRNRPKADLALDCPNGNERLVAPCGYLSAPLFIVDGHAFLEHGPWQASAVAIFGHLARANAISERNARLSNNLGVPRSPVAREAFGVWGEVGFDVAPALGLDPVHHVRPWVRAEYYDTMFRTQRDLFDNPRFERLIFAGGVAYDYGRRIIPKVGVSHRRFGSGALRPETSVELSVGFVL